MGGSSQVTQLHVQSGWQFDRERLHGQPGVILAPPPVFNAGCVSMLLAGALCLGELSSYVHHIDLQYYSRSEINV